MMKLNGDAHAFEGGKRQAAQNASHTRASHRAHHALAGAAGEHIQYVLLCDTELLPRTQRVVRGRGSVRLVIGMMGGGGGGVCRGKESTVKRETATSGGHTQRNTQHHQTRSNSLLFGCAQRLRRAPRSDRARPPTRRGWERQCGALCQARNSLRCFIFRWDRGRAGAAVGVHHLVAGPPRRAARWGRGDHEERKRTWGRQQLQRGDAAGPTGIAKRGGDTVCPMRLKSKTRGLPREQDGLGGRKQLRGRRGEGQGG